MADKTTIDIWWDKGGRISYSISGYISPPPRDDKRLWYLVPSALLLLAHQLGAMKPSHGLIIAGTVMDMIFDNKYVLVPINSALKGAVMECRYIRQDSITVQFHPKRGMFANSDSVEEGIRQLLNNYVHYAYTQADNYTQLVYKVLASLAIEAYFDFIEKQIQNDFIGADRDKWSMSFPYVSNEIIRLVSANWCVPVPGTSFENEKWINEQVNLLEEQKALLDDKRRSLFATMGLN